MDNQEIKHNINQLQYPVGSIIAFFGVSDPYGWLICDGDTIGAETSAATHKGSKYKNLYDQLWTMVKSYSANLTISAAIGLTNDADWAALKTITIPNMKGIGVCGIGTQDINARTKTGPTNLGDKQEDQMQGHYHGPTTLLRDSTARYHTDSGGPYAFGTGAAATTGPLNDGTNGEPRTGTETRESRIGLNFIIKL